MSGAEEDRKRAARAEQVALFRYQLIREAADPALSTRQRGRLARELAAGVHPGPFGDEVVVSRATIDRWIRAWRSGGFAALAPPARQVMPRTDAQVLELAAGLKREKPARTAAQVARVLRASCGWSPSVRTLQRHFGRLELTTRPDGRPPQVFGRFEAGRPNELWTGDALHGPQVAGRKAYLLLAAVQGERHRGGCVVDGERAFRGGSGCGRVACDDTVSMSDMGRPSPLPFREARGGP